MNLLQQAGLVENRRQFFSRSARGIGALALGSLLNPAMFAAADRAATGKLVGGQPHVRPRAKRVIYLLQSGAPSQMELLDYKPRLKEMHGEELPDSIRQGQRLTGMTARQKSFPIVNPPFAFKQYGESGPG